MKKPFILLLIIFANTAHGASELDKQMHHLTGRIRMYLKCIRPRSTCSTEERSAISQTILRDGGILLFALGTAFTSMVLIHKYTHATDIAAEIHKLVQDSDFIGYRVFDESVEPITLKTKNHVTSYKIEFNPQSWIGVESYYFTQEKAQQFKEKMDKLVKRLQETKQLPRNVQIISAVQ